MSLLFISDLHLDPERHGITELFLRFLRDEAQQIEGLYILGDLFEAWIGDDAPGELGSSVERALRACARSGTQIGFIRGNRDFLLDAECARACGMQLLPDPCVMSVAGEPTLLLHGDLLCTDDLEYQRFRAGSRTPAWREGFLARPVAERQAFAAQARAESRKHQQGLDMAITDANPQAVDDMLRLYGVRRMIHGHTHRPAVHEHAEGALRYVLGDWYEQGSVLRIEAGEWSLQTLRA
jgi:UDP-2,3-diacylglucosamine hydrolase